MIDQKACNPGTDLLIPLAGKRRLPLPRRVGVSHSRARSRCSSSVSSRCWLRARRGCRFAGNRCNRHEQPRAILAESQRRSRHQGVRVFADDKITIQVKNNCVAVIKRTTFSEWLDSSIDRDIHRFAVDDVRIDRRERRRLADSEEFHWYDWLNASRDTPHLANSGERVASTKHGSRTDAGKRPRRPSQRL
jgi:hypothetical protein